MASGIVISDYEIVTARRVTDLQDRVREFLKNGYRPQGGIAVLQGEDIGENAPHMVFAQAMVREAEAQTS